MTTTDLPLDVDVDEDPDTTRDHPGAPDAAITIAEHAHNASDLTDLLAMAGISRAATSAALTRIRTHPTPAQARQALGPDPQETPPVAQHDPDAARSRRAFVEALDAARTARLARLHPPITRPTAAPEPDDQGEDEPEDLDVHEAIRDTEHDAFEAEWLPPSEPGPLIDDQADLPHPADATSSEAAKQEARPAQPPAADPCTCHHKGISHPRWGRCNRAGCRCSGFEPMTATTPGETR